MRIPPLPRALVAVLALAFPATAESLRIYVIDVEQGASTLLVSPAGHTLLVDSGKSGHGARIHPVMNTAGMTQIDHFVLTHYHEDHMGGIDDLITDQHVTVVHAYDRGQKGSLAPSASQRPPTSVTTHRWGTELNSSMPARRFRSIPR